MDNEKLIFTITRQWSDSSAHFFYYVTMDKNIVGCIANEEILADWKARMEEHYGKENIEFVDNTEEV